MSNFLFKDRDGQTPLPEEFQKGLLPKHIQNMLELDEYEEANIVEGLAWLEKSNDDGLNYEFWQKLHRKLFGKCTHHSADAIYATNTNRKYCTENKIVTNFIPKGRQREQDIEPGKIMRSVLNKERGTKLEGSFGNEKNHYLLQKINARNEYTELCWIFFGIHTANASIISQRMAKAAQAIKTRAA